MTHFFNTLRKITFKISIIYSKEPKQKFGPCMVPFGKYSGTPVSAHSVSLVSVIRRSPWPENM